MKWYLLPAGVEFSQWLPNTIAKHLPGVTLPTAEPASAILTDAWSLLPLTDNGPTLADHQRVASRVIINDGETATAVYATGDKPLEDYKAERKQALKAVREAKIAEGYLHVDSGKRVQIDADSRANLVSAYSMARDGYWPAGGRAWRMMDNSWVMFDAAGIMALSVSAGAHYSNLFAHHAVLEAEIEDSGTVSEVTSIDIDGGWPE